MKNYIIITLIIISLCGFFGCKKANTKTDNELNTTIVIYYSLDDNTEKIAKTISKHLKCGKFRIEPIYPYTKKDLDKNNPESRINKEIKERNNMPDIKKLSPYLDVYDTVILGYPIWEDHAPIYLNSYLQIAGFPKGMKVYPFAVSDKREIGNTAKELFKNEKNAKLKKGITFNSNTSDEQIIKWVNSLDL